MVWCQWHQTISTHNVDMRFLWRKIVSLQQQWPRREWTEWIPKLVWIVMTHNDLCTCIALTKWDGPVACVLRHSKCYHFAATKTSETISVKQYEHDRVTRCTFSVDFKEIKTISQSLPSTYAICLQPRQSGRHRGEIGTHRLSGTMNFRIRI